MNGVTNYWPALLRLGTTYGWRYGNCYVPEVRHADVINARTRTEEYAMDEYV